MGEVSKDLWDCSGKRADGFEKDQSDGYEVGYLKPASKTQFKKGKSGNPLGRPRGAKNATTILKKALLEEVTATINGRKRRLSKYEALILRLVNKALTGDHRAIEYLLARVPTVRSEFGEVRKQGGLSDTAERAIREALGLGILPKKPEPKEG